MQELQNALGRFVSGVIDQDELCASIRAYAQRDLSQQAVALTWVKERVGSGRLPDAVGRAIEQALANCGNDLVVERSNDATQARSEVSGDASNSAAPTLSRETFQRKPAEQAGGERELDVGTILNARFTLVEELGGGGMGRVFKAHDAHGEDAHDRHPYVAVKVLSEDFKRHPDSFIALQREVKRARTLPHENVITVYDTHRDGPHDYMSMEFLEGRPLDELLRTDFAAGLSLEKARRIIQGIGAALEYGHANGIIHSDLKPGNVFICNDGRVKVLDFGIARPMPPPGKEVDETFFDPGKRLGALTPAYAAIEMWNREPPDPRDDIYALACLSYELLSGLHPYSRLSARDAFEGNKAPPRIKSLTRPQWEALRKGLAFKRKDRTATVAEFLRPFALTSLFRRHRKMIFASAITLGGAGFAIGFPYYNDYMDERAIGLYRQEAPPPRRDLTPQQQQEIDDSLWLADDYLREAKLSLKPADLAYILSEGANNVNQVIAGVLAVDPGNRKAQQVKSQVADLYARKARQLIGARDFKTANELVGYGRKVDYNVALYRLERELCRKQPTTCKPDQSR